MCRWIPMKPSPQSMVLFCTPLALNSQSSKPCDSRMLLKPKSVLVGCLLKTFQWLSLTPPTSLLSSPTQLPITHCTYHILLLLGPQAHQTHSPILPWCFPLPRMFFPQTSTWLTLSPTSRQLRCHLSTLTPPIYLSLF